MENDLDKEKRGRLAVPLGLRIAKASYIDQFPVRCLYSPEVMKAFTISAFTKLPLN